MFVFFLVLILGSYAALNVTYYCIYRTFLAFFRATFHCSLRSTRDLLPTQHAISKTIQGGSGLNRRIKAYNYLMVGCFFISTMLNSIFKRRPTSLTVLADYFIHSVAHVDAKHIVRIYTLHIQMYVTKLHIMSLLKELGQQVCTKEQPDTTIVECIRQSEAVLEQQYAKLTSALIEFKRN